MGMTTELMTGTKLSTVCSVPEAKNAAK